MIFVFEKLSEMGAGTVKGQFSLGFGQKIMMELGV